MAGEDDDAKAALISAVRAGGVNAIDADPLRVPANSKRWGSFKIELAAAELVGWTGGFAVVR